MGNSSVCDNTKRKTCLCGLDSGQSGIFQFHTIECQAQAHVLCNFALTLYP